MYIDDNIKEIILVENKGKKRNMYMKNKNKEKRK